SGPRLGLGSRVSERSCGGSNPIATRGLEPAAACASHQLARIMLRAETPGRQPLFPLGADLPKAETARLSNFVLLNYFHPPRMSLSPMGERLGSSPLAGASDPACGPAWPKRAIASWWTRPEAATSKLSVCSSGAIRSASTGLPYTSFATPQKQ